MHLHRLIAAATTLLLTPLAPAQQQDQPIIFAFDVRITLSDLAAERLKTTREGIVVSAYYTGEPLPSAENRANQIGTIDLGTENREVIGAEGLVRITGKKVDLRRLEWIKGSVLLNVNVYSARRTNPDNILSCDFFDGKLSSAVRKTPVLHCTLIEERTATDHKH
jgi:hypothetical protein